MKKISFALLAAIAVFSTPLPAQDKNNSDWDKIVLEDKAGNVMASTGGDYQTADIGKLFVVGEHLMLSGERTKAKIVYYELDDEGKIIDKCVKDYTDPNTYIVDATCVPAAGWASGGQISGANAGIIAGAALIGAALLNGGDSVAPPVSASQRP